MIYKILVFTVGLALVPVTAIASALLVAAAMVRILVADLLN